MKTVLLTGASGGIGKAASEIFADAGWRVIGVDREVVPSTSAEVLRVDLADEEQIRDLFEQLARRGEKLHALVNNAATQLCKPLLGTSASEWDSLMAVNLRAVFLMMQGAFPLLSATHGAIVNVGSVHALATSSHMAAYAASKGALDALTRAAALEFAAAAVRVNAIHPGATDTPMLHAGLSRESFGGHPGKSVIDLFEEKHPLGRIGRPEEIARAIVFLAENNESSFITGQALVVDGGVMARLSSE